MIVCDASAVLELLFGTAAGAEVARRLEAEGETLHAPHLVDVEVTQVLRRWVRREFISTDDAERARDDLRNLDVIRYPHPALLDRAWDLRDSLTAYDAVYIALAEALACPLVTCDARLARAHGHRARVEVIGRVTRRR